MSLISDRIIKYALMFKGIKEVGNNEGWELVYFSKWGKTFIQLMRWVGWKISHAWCVYFGKLLWKLAYGNHFISKQLDKLFTPNAVRTWKNFKASDFVCSDIPTEGSLAIWQLHKGGKPTTSGHLGVVISYDNRVFNTIDGNTSGENKRDGDIVGENIWVLNRPIRKNGLNLLGFVHPKKILIHTV